MGKLKLTLAALVIVAFVVWSALPIVAEFAAGLR